MYLRREFEEPVFVHDAGFYHEAGIELLSGERAERLDHRARELVTSRRTIRYDGLVLATGASPRTLDVPGAELEGIALPPADARWQELVSIRRSTDHLFLRYRRARHRPIQKEP